MKDSFKMWLALPLPSIQMEMCSGSQADGGKFTAMYKSERGKGKKLMDKNWGETEKSQQTKI